MTARLAEDAALRGVVRGGPSGLSGPARGGGAGDGGRAAAAGCAERGRHAGAGQVPARAGRARTRRAGRQPARPGSGRCRRAVVGGRPVRNDGGWLMTRRVAAIDCGTNSIRLLVADVDPGRGTLTDVDRRMEIVRLGQGVDTTGRLAPEALDRTLAALSRLRGRHHPPRRRRRADGGDQRDPGRQQCRGVHPPGHGGPGRRSRGSQRGRGGPALLHRRDRGTGWRPVSAPALSRRGHRRRLDRVRPGRPARCAGSRGTAVPAGPAAGPRLPRPPASTSGVSG